MAVRYDREPGPAPASSTAWRCGTIASRDLRPASSIGASSGDLVASPSTTPKDYCLVFAKLQRHLTCDSVTVEVTATTDPVTGVQTVMYVDAADGSGLNLLLDTGAFQWNATTPPDLG